jgi:hypothetical protein
VKHLVRRVSTLTLAAVITGLITALVGAGPAHAASSPLLDAQELRSDVSALTDDYIDRYQDRLTPAQERQLTKTARQARREMTTLVRAIKKAERRNTPSAWKAAHRQHQRAAAMVDGRFDDVRATLESELTFVERLSAFSDYSSSMRDFQSLGVELARRAAK